VGIPSASYSITMRVHLSADPLGIGRITTAVGEAEGTRVHTVSDRKLSFQRSTALAR
jgi:hypothetical protein